MKAIDLPFKIGDQYENWEFNLDFCEKERIEGYDSYIYIREISFLGIVPQYVELIFCLDILEVVILTFEKKQQGILKKLFSLPKNSNHYENLFNCFKLNNKLEIWLIVDRENFKILYGKRSNLKRVCK